ncbi:MipA/OmpV family protein [Tropicimonas sp. IMCC34043]|uniref:MipA/OmpV family protein n=1 Tax=Tropicimonas sp. IMCC34043 TaxID=2248760 RepID=UPI0013002EF0|nr:MipA/OmpV family protein [Tropicimonas sp. IMCC34043]
MQKRYAALFAALAVAAAPLAAQETETPTVTEVGPARTVPIQYSNLIDPSKNFVLAYDIRVGTVTRPAYLGSDEYVTAPDFAIHFNYARLKGLGEYGDPTGTARPRAFGVRGSLRYIPGRDASQHDDLKGLDDIDPTVELGLGAVYRTRNFETFADVRYGFVGSEAFYGELGADGIIYPTNRWEFRFGPRLGFGADGFAQTYFGVTSDESAKSGLEVYDASGGLLSAGLVASARYRFTDLWGVEATVRGDRLLNDAADSPITGTGSADQYQFRLGITRELMLQF